MLTYPNQNAVSSRDLAWNTRGEKLSDGAMTAEEAMGRVGLLGRNVRKVPLTTGFGDHPQQFEDAGLVVPDQYANVATIDGNPKVLGVVGSRYTNFQAEECSDLLDTIVDEGGAHYVAGGTLADDRKMFMVMRLPDSITVGGEDRSDLYLGVMNSWDGSGSLVAWVTAMRLRCTNMLNSSMRGALSRWTLRHTSGIKGKVEDARNSLALAHKWTTEFNGQAEEWLRTPFTDADLVRLLDEGLAKPSDSEHEGWRARADEKRNTIRFLFNEAETNEFGRGTKWAAYNALTEYADWYLPIKGNDADGHKRAERNLDSSTVLNFKQKAADALVAA